LGKEKKGENGLPAAKTEANKFKREPKGRGTSGMGKSKGNSWEIQKEKKTESYRTGG